MNTQTIAGKKVSTDTTQNKTIFDRFVVAEESRILRRFELFQRISNAEVTVTIEVEATESELSELTNRLRLVEVGVRENPGFSFSQHFRHADISFLGIAMCIPDRNPITGDREE